MNRMNYFLFTPGRIVVRFEIFVAMILFIGIRDEFFALIYYLSVDEKCR